MKKSWSISKDKVLINFSAKYCQTDAEVLSSDAFYNILEKYYKKINKEYSKNKNTLNDLFGSKTIEDLVNDTILVFKLLTTMNSKEISDNFKKFNKLYENRKKFNEVIEQIYTYWRNLERYAIIYEHTSSEGVERNSFIETKRDFDRLILKLYRKISTNNLISYPNVYRQVKAGTNAGLVLKNFDLNLPIEYEKLYDIPIIEAMVLETPFITYPKRNTRSGFFKEDKINPINNAFIDKDSFFCYPIWVGNLLCFTFCHEDALTHLVSLSNLFEPAKLEDIERRKADIMVVFGYEDPRGAVDLYYRDEKNKLIVGYISNDDKYDYFGYMKKIILTIHNLKQIENGNLPIHGSMIKLQLNDGIKANIVIVGDSGAGKSESIEALRSLSKEYLNEMTVIFDDMGVFSHDEKNNEIKAYGTEIGAFVRLDDLESGYAFKQLDRSIFMNPDRTNARLISPVSLYEEIMNGEKIDFFLYSNNYDEVLDKSIERFESVEDAKKVFISGKRKAKGTTSEKGITTSFFANPFGPYQEQDKTNILIDKYFEILFEKDIYVGEIKTELGIEGREKDGPKEAAIELFKLIKKFN